MVIGFKKLFWCHFAVKNAPLINESTNQRLEIVLAFMKAKGHSIWSKKYYFYRLETHNVHICNLTKCSIFCHWPLQRPTKARTLSLIWRKFESNACHKILVLHRCDQNYEKEMICTVLKFTFTFQWQKFRETNVFTKVIKY